MDVVFGVEEELIMIHKNDYLMMDISEMVIDSLWHKLQDKKVEFYSDKYLFKISEEPRREQIEYSTNPLLIGGIMESMNYGRKLLKDVLGEYSSDLLYYSKHPHSDPNPLTGVHTHISVKGWNDFFFMNCYNQLWNYLPELIALTKNSDRLNISGVLTPSNFLNKKQHARQLLLDKNTGWRVQKSILFMKEKPYYQDDRMVDMAVRGKYCLNDKVMDGGNNHRIELRIFDIHKSLEFVNLYLKTIEYLLNIIPRNELVKQRDDREEMYNYALMYPRHRYAPLTRSLNSILKEVDEDYKNIIQRDRITQQKEMEKIERLKRV